MSLDIVPDQLQPKAFGKIHFGTVVTWILISAVFLYIFSEMEINEFKYDFHCGGAKSENINLVRGQCYEKYEKQYNKLAFPVYAFVISNFIVIICVCVIYSQLVTPTINRLSRSIRNDDPEIQSRDQENALSTGYKLFGTYCCQLWIRLSFTVLFIIVQTQWLYPLKFPSDFHCNLTSSTTQPRNSSDNFQHSTIHDCHNQRAVKKNSWMNAVVVVNGIFAAGILVEILYLFSQACRKRDFKQNSKFLTSHLNPSEEFKQEEQRRELVKNKQKGTEHETNILQEFIYNTMKRIKEDTDQPPELRSLFLSPSGKPKHLTLDQIYTNPVVIPNIANYDFTEDRRRNLEIYTKSDEKNKTLRGPEDILNYKEKKIYIVGRPGIGKTLWCTKLLRDWAFEKIFHKTSNYNIHFDVAFFFELKTFKDATKLSLRKLLTCSKYSPTIELDDVVWNYILKNPERVLLIFDGIDEFALKSNISKEDSKSVFRNIIDIEMPLSALYVKLTTGKLLNGAAVITTTRPTALPCIEGVPYDEIYEILGFSFNQVKAYITRFVEGDKKAGDIIMGHITSNINILSLCYIPGSCFIICSSLFKRVKFYASKSPSLPARLTDIYKKAVKIFYLRHHKEHRNESFTHKDFETDDLPPEEEKKLEELEEMAFKGIEKKKFTFSENEVHGMRMRDSGLFNHIPDREPNPFQREEQFCFIHLTIQEFFAARHLTNMSETELRIFVSKNIKEGNWQLVFQFLAGLMQDKNHLPSKIITDLLPVKTEEKESKYYNEKWGPMERKVNCWPTKDEQNSAGTLIQCLNENSQMTPEVQRKLEQINYNCVNFVACGFTAVDCSSLVNVINVQQISHVDLSFNNIGPLGCFEICKLLKESQLSWLNLTHNQLTDEAAKCLAEAINNKCKLRKLNLAANNISDTGAQHLAKAIINNDCHLHTLDLSENKILVTGAEHLAKAINNNNCQLLALNLSYNCISHSGVKYLAEAISNNNCQLLMLDLTAVDIHTGVKDLAKAISNNNCGLQTLNLTANDISDNGAQHLAKAISNKNCRLHTLNLKANDISHKGAQRLAEAIKNNNCQLRALNLSENCISDTGARPLAKAIINNSCRLQRLNLSENKITNVGAQHLAEAINNNNCQLHTLDLSNNPAITQDARNLLSSSNSNCEVIL